MSDYDAIIFDCDGTLIDTMPGHYRAWRATMAKYDIDFDEERFYSLGGVPTPRIVAILAEENDKTLDADAIAHEKETLFFEQSLDALQPIEAVVGVARENRGKLPLAVATGSHRWSATKMLDHIGITDWFDTLVTADDVEHPKPHPETYLRAAEQLGVDPKRCLAYEDSEPGLVSAREAGMTVINVHELLAACD